MDLESCLGGERKKPWIIKGEYPTFSKSKNYKTGDSRRSRIYFESNLNYSYVWESSLNHAEELVPWLDELIFICVTSVARLDFHAFNKNMNFNCSFFHY